MTRNRRIYQPLFILLFLLFYLFVTFFSHISNGMADAKDAYMPALILRYLSMECKKYLLLFCFWGKFSCLQWKFHCPCSLLSSYMCRLSSEWFFCFVYVFLIFVLVLVVLLMSGKSVRARALMWYYSFSTIARKYNMHNEDLKALHTYI